MTISPPHDADIIIVGGGPVGFGLAIDLALRDIRVIIVERHTTIQPIPKGQNLTQRTGEHFQRWGVTKAIQDATPIPRDFGNAGVTAYGTLLSGYHHDWFNRSSVAAFYAAENERLPQYITEDILQKRAAELSNITSMTGWSFIGYEETSQGVAVKIAETKGDHELCLTGKYLVGTDGANSLVREAAGITQTSDGHQQRMALLVFHSNELNDILAAFGGKTIFNALSKKMKGYWQFLGRVDLEGNWFFHAPVPPKTQVANYDFNALLYEAVGTSFEAKFNYVGLWDLRISVADNYNKSRVFIAGDAAHSHPPYGGYGVNTGFEDARNLSWKITAAIEGWAGSGLLDSYSSERKPVFESTRDDFIVRMINQDANMVTNFDPEIDRAAFEKHWHKRSTGEDIDVTQFLPQISGSPIVFGPINGVTSARGIHQHLAQAGFHLSPQVLSNDKNIFDCLGGGRLGACFSLILIDQPSEIKQAFEQAATCFNIPLVIIESAKTGGTALWQNTIILVRPDEFVAYAGTDLGTDDPVLRAKEILQRVVGGP